MSNILTADEKEHGKWFIGHTRIGSDFYKQTTPNAPLDLSTVADNFTFLHAPSGLFYADPIIVKNDGKNYVFFEWFDYKRGKLAFYTLDDKLQPSEISFLDTDILTHTSYPYIFNDSGTMYLIPERCHAGRIDLYKCAEFPKKWDFVKTIIPNVHAGDNTIIKHNNVYYLFTTIYTNRVNHFCIYYASNITGPWHPHPIVNTNSIEISGHLSRGAGLPFRISERLFRPAQYSNRSINGEAVILYEITHLSENNFKRTAVGLMSHSNLSFLRATHTFSLCGDIICIDGRPPRDNEPEFTEIKWDSLK